MRSGEAGSLIGRERGLSGDPELCIGLMAWSHSACVHDHEYEHEQQPDGFTWIPLV
jgi:hypothetical protein